MFFALQLNPDGSMAGYSASSEPDPMPVGLVPCTQDQYINRRQYTIQAGAVVAIGAAAALAQAQADKIKQINTACQSALNAITAPYPAGEALTWDQQLAEAQAYTASSSASVSLLAAIAGASGETVAQLAASVIAANSAYKAAAGAAIGKRQALTAQVNAAATAPAVQAITW